MQNNKKDTFMRIGAVGLSVIATTAIVAGASYAYNGSPQKEGGSFAMENCENFKAKFENKDFSGWKSMDEEKLSKMTEIRELMRSGDFAAAQEIRDSLGLPEKDFTSQSLRMKQGKNIHNWQKMEDARLAIQNNDYSAWKEAIGEHPLAETITEENFPKLVEAHNLMQAGNFEEAKEIREALGVTNNRCMGQRLNK